MPGFHQPDNGILSRAQPHIFQQNLADETAGRLLSTLQITAESNVIPSWDSGKLPNEPIVQ